MVEDLIASQSFIIVYVEYFLNKILQLRANLLIWEGILTNLHIL